MKNLTLEQIKVINILVARDSSLTEMAKMLGCSRQAVFFRIKWLKKKGCVETVDRKFRVTSKGLQLGRETIK